MKLKQMMLAHFSERIEQLNCHTKIKEAMVYSLVSNGKYIRPLVFLRFISDVNISEKDKFDIAMAIECVHVYSLIHDDLPAMDDDDLRRGMMTNHIKFGEDIAILAGDALLTYSFELLSNLDIDDNTKIRLIKILSQKSGVNSGMINGQVLDILAHEVNVDEAYLEQIHFQKTACMLQVPLLFGAILTNSKLEKVELLGYLLGINYQIQDDYLDQYGDEEEIGKQIGSDLKNDKKTYTSFYEKEQLESLITSNFKKINELIIDLELNEELRTLILSLEKRRS